MSENMMDAYTLLLAGRQGDSFTPSEMEALERALNSIVMRLAQVCEKSHSTLRLLTGKGNRIDQVAADIASLQDLPLHILAAGSTDELSPTQQRAERVVFLGEKQSDFVDVYPEATRDEIALCMSDCVVLAGSGIKPSVIASSEVKIMRNAALAMKPVLWVGSSGAVFRLNRAVLTPAVRLRLSSPMASLEELLNAFEADPELRSLDEMVSSLLSACNETRSAGAASSQRRTGRIHSFILSLASGSIVSAFRGLFTSTNTAYRGPAFSDGYAATEDDVLAEAFDQADIEANLSAGKHRDATWAVYGCSSLAVFSAVAGAIHLSTMPTWIWAVIEGVALAAIIIVLRIARGAKVAWHAKWLRHRYIAEQLRYIRMGLPILALPKSLMSSAWGVASGADRSSELVLLHPELLFVQHTVARNGLPVDFSGMSRWVAANPEGLDILRNYVVKVIEDQITYHTNSAEIYHRVHHGLHLFAMLLFGGALLAVGAHLLGLHAKWLLFLTAFSPALAAALHGVSTKLEIARLGDQSRATKDSLLDLKDALQGLSFEKQDTWALWLQLRKLAQDAAHSMADENSNWKKLVSQQEPELPA
jgi:hypothetical protein